MARPEPEPPPTPEPQSTPSPIDPIPPIPSETPRPPRKHISLGLSVINGKMALTNFTFRLNVKLNPQEIYVYMASEWPIVGLSNGGDLSAAGFGIRFSEASTRAEHIHFNLEGIGLRTINHYINNYGGLGNFTQAKFFTAAELHLVRSTGLCLKTSFYTNGNIVPSASAKSKICGP